MMYWPDPLSDEFGLYLLDPILGCMPGAFRKLHLERTDAFAILVCLSRRWKCNVELSSCWSGQYWLMLAAVTMSPGETLIGGRVAYTTYPSGFNDDELCRGRQSVRWSKVGRAGTLKASLVTWTDPLRPTVLGLYDDAAVDEKIGPSQQSRKRTEAR
jgi:hypothetical protein